MISDNFVYHSYIYNIEHGKTVRTFEKRRNYYNALYRRDKLLYTFPVSFRRHYYRAVFGYYSVSFAMVYIQGGDVAAD